MATDEGVLGRTLGCLFFARWHGRCIARIGSAKLYNVYRFENGDAAMHLLFRDHTISDLDWLCVLGDASARSSAPPDRKTLRNAAQPVLDSGQRCRRFNDPGWRKCVGVLPAIRVVNFFAASMTRFTKTRHRGRDNV